MNNVVKTSASLASDIGRMRRESGMVMATVTSLDDDEIGKPTKCAGWTRAHVIAHLALDAEAMTNLATWAATGREHPDYASREERNADIEAAAGQSAAELACALERANDRLVAAFRALEDGAQVPTLPTLFSGEVNAFSLPARRTTELIVHHDDLDTTWEWHEADPEAIVDAIEVCVLRLQAEPRSPDHDLGQQRVEAGRVRGAHRAASDSARRTVRVCASARSLMPTNARPSTSARVRRIRAAVSCPSGVSSITTARRSPGRGPRVMSPRCSSRSRMPVSVAGCSPAWRARALGVSGPLRASTSRQSRSTSLSASLPPTWWFSRASWIRRSRSAALISFPARRRWRASLSCVCSISYEFRTI